MTFTEDKQIKLAQETASSWLVTSESNDTATTVSYTCILLLIDANIVWQKVEKLQELLQTAVSPAPETSSDNKQYFDA